MKASVVRDAKRERKREGARARETEGGDGESGWMEVGGKQQSQKLRSRACDKPPALSTGAKDDHHRLQAHAFTQPEIIPH